MERQKEGLILRGPNVNCGLHINAELEVIHVLRGRVTVCRDTVTITLEAGKALLVPPYHPHGFSASPDSAARVYLFSEAVYHESLNHWGCPEGAAVTVSAAATEYLEELLRNRYRWRPDVYAATVLAVYWNLFLTTETTASPAEGDGWERELVAYLTDHLSETVTAGELALRLGRNARQLSGALYQCYGVHLPELLRNMRVNRAVMLLETSGKTVTEVAGECGFSSLRSFNRVFRQTIGQTPSQYRSERWEKAQKKG